ncbi:hypothetical protein [Bosea sp. (in: a-proteobacteria)]|uniref:hypothetical protein n=1 Tax=Bosea sp. (in: a-proteobacteria) TaxID=1871050 RepID=UPI00273426C9|nr:hypothetical protein [Bosea sp. (in: a-proteobacteria)]MDP3408069.1 hypothetical protein [Bosea sp. (in: a-proteobacteria)]
MSKLYRHLVWLDHAMDAITDADLTIRDEVEAVTILRQVNADPYVEVELTNPGWAAYAPGARRAAAVVESDDGTMATATVLARGWLRSLPDTLGKNGVTITLECYGTVEEIRLAKNEAARAFNAANLPPENEYNQGGALEGDETALYVPDQDWLMGRLETERDQVEVGRTLDWHCDPVTHAWSLHDYTVPMGATRSIGERYDPKTLSRSPTKGCPRRVKMKLVCNFSTNLTGICNIAPAIFMPVTSMTGYNYFLQQRPGLSQGWQLDVPVVQVVNSVTRPFGPLAYDMSRRLVFETFNAGTNTWDRTYSGIGWGRHRYTVEFFRYQYFFMSWVARWTYAQNRREVVHLTLDVPTQEVTGLVDELELSDRSLSQIYTTPLFLTEDQDEDAEAEEPPAPYDAERIYDTGDKMLLQGREYVSTVDGLQGVSWSVSIVSPTSASVVVDPRWQPTNRRPAFPSPVHSVFDTRRGKASIAAAFRLMRKEVFKLLYEDITVTVDRAHFPAWALGDTCEMLLPGRFDEPMKPASGRVTSITERLSARGDTVQISLQIGKGQGGDAVAREASINEFGATDYFNGDYTDTDETDFYTAGDDIEWTLDADPLVMPIDTSKLGQSSYSVLQISVQGSAAAHQDRVDALAAAGRRITALSSADLPPTSVNVTMRSLNRDGTIIRKMRAAGVMTRTPRGMTL